MLQEIIRNYEHLRKNIPALIKAAGYRNDFIASKMQLKASNFAVKKQRSSWNNIEMEKLAKILDNKDVESAYEILLIQESRAGGTVTSDEFEKHMKWK